MANTFKFGNGNWAVKDGAALAYNDENNNFKPLPFTFTRSSSATRVNKDGLIEVIGQNKPRIDFLNNTSGHLMLEPTRTNFLTYSEEFESWSSGSSYVTANQAVSPDGKTTADELTKNGSFVQIQNTASVSSGVDWVFSLFAKKNTTSYITMRIATGSNDVRKYINLDTNETGDSGGNQTGFISTTIEDYSNGWKRISIRVTTGGTLAYCNLYAGQAGNTTYDGEVYIWGSQLESGQYQSSYIPTSGSSSSVTRSDEYAIDAGNSNVFSDTELSWFLDIEGFAEDGTTRYISISDGGGSPYTNGYAIQYRSDGALRIFRNGLDFADAICVVDIDQTIRQKIAIRFKQNDMKVYINGVSQSLNGSYVFQSMSGIDIMKTTQQNSTTANAFDGKIYEMRVWNEALSDSQLQALTS